MCAGRAGAVPGKNGFRESSGRVPGKFRNRSRNRLGSRFQEGLDRFRGSRFQEPVPRLGLEVPGTGSGNRLGSTFQEPVPTGLGVRGTGCKVRISSRAGGSGTGSKVPRFQNHIPRNRSRNRFRWVPRVWIGSKVSRLG